MTSQPTFAQILNRSSVDENEHEPARQPASGPVAKGRHGYRHRGNADYASRAYCFERTVFPVLSLGVPLLVQHRPGLSAAVNALSPGRRIVGLRDSQDYGIRHANPSADSAS